MEYLDYSAVTPIENLAIDELLLEEVETGVRPPTLRVWESPVYFVVLGYSSPLELDVYTDACTRDGIPILRRISGGGTVLQGPGCLNYAIVDHCAGAFNIRESSKRVFSHLYDAFPDLKLSCKGTSDIIWNGKKCIGHAERYKKLSFLYHGSILYNFDIAQMTRYLKIPPKQPSYREGRSHEDFVTNIPLDAASLKQGLCRAFACQTRDSLALQNS